MLIACIANGVWDPLRRKMTDSVMKSIFSLCYGSAIFSNLLVAGSYDGHERPFKEDKKQKCPEHFRYACSSTFVLSNCVKYAAKGFRREILERIYGLVVHEYMIYSEARREWPQNTAMSC